MSVLDGRRLRFEAAEGRDGGYNVAAVSVSPVLEPVWVSLGVVYREGRSTDSRIAGTRLRRSGKGATEWSAQVPLEQWDRSSSLPRSYLQGTYDRGWRLEGIRGERWDRREDAARALADWYDHPEKRRKEGGA